MQFINIVVHSVEDMNFRVHLQYEFTKLGLDEYLDVSMGRFLALTRRVGVFAAWGCWHVWALLREPGCSCLCPEGSRDTSEAGETAGRQYEEAKPLAAPNVLPPTAFRRAAQGSPTACAETAVLRGLTGLRPGATLPRGEKNPLLRAGITDWELNW